MFTFITKQAIIKPKKQLIKMQTSFDKIIQGYKKFRAGDNSVMQELAAKGQQPKIMVVACCDSRVDPAILLQCDPGDLFVVRNVANIIPPFENDEYHHGTSAALEFAIRRLNVEHLIILGHSQCGGIESLINRSETEADDFISNWINLIKVSKEEYHDADACAKSALLQSYQNCQTFPWLKAKMQNEQLDVHLWFFDIKKAEILVYNHDKKEYSNL